MIKYIFSFSLVLSGLVCGSVFAEDDQLELETTFIKGNKEMPQILYLVPWKDIKKSKRDAQGLILHSLFGDLFDPANPNETLVSTGIDSTK